MATELQRLASNAHEGQDTKFYAESVRHCLCSLSQPQGLLLGFPHFGSFTHQMSKVFIRHAVKPVSCGMSRSSVKDISSSFLCLSKRRYVSVERITTAGIPLREAIFGGGRTSRADNSLNLFLAYWSVQRRRKSDVQFQRNTARHSSSSFGEALLRQSITKIPQKSGQ